MSGCEWCGAPLDELMDPNINELCVDCTAGVDDEEEL